MENKRAAILVLVIVAAVAITAGGAYAMGRQTSGRWYSPGANYGYGMGSWMTGGSAGYGGMMGGYGGHSGMMGSYGTPMYQYMERYWNSTNVP